MCSARWALLLGSALLVIGCAGVTPSSVPGTPLEHPHAASLPTLTSEANGGSHYGATGSKSRP